MVKTELSPELQECAKVLEKLSSHQDSEPFRVPVDWQAWGLDDYPKIVKHPMDLSTVESKLISGKYDGLPDFARDIRLIWANCMSYNADGSTYYKLAQKFEKMFDKDMNKLAKKFGTSTKALKDAAKPVSKEEKARFCRNIYEIRAVSVGKVVQTLDEHCPEALQKENPEELEINVDAIDSTTFRKLDAYVKECVQKEKLKKKLKKEKASSSKSGSKSTTPETTNKTEGENTSTEPLAGTKRDASALEPVIGESLANLNPPGAPESDETPSLKKQKTETS